MQPQARALKAEGFSILIKYDGEACNPSIVAAPPAFFSSCLPENNKCIALQCEKKELDIVSVKLNDRTIQIVSPDNFTSVELDP